MLGSLGAQLGSIGSQLGSIGLSTTSAAAQRIVDLTMRRTRELPIVFRRLPNEE